MKSILIFLFSFLSIQTFGQIVFPSRNPHSVPAAVPDTNDILIFAKKGNVSNEKQLYKIRYDSLLRDIGYNIDSLQWAIYVSDSLKIKTNDTVRLFITPSGNLNMPIKMYADDAAAFDGGVKRYEWYQTPQGTVQQLNVVGNANKTTFLNNQFARSDIWEQEIGSVITVNDTVTIPAGKVLKFKPGGKIIGSGVINGGIINAHHLQWIFDTTLTVNPEACVDNIFSGRWYGAHPDRQNNQPFIQKAIDVCIQNYLPNLYLPRGSYNLTKGLLFIADRNKDSNYVEQVTINFYGERMTQTSNSSETVLNCLHNDNFAIALVFGKTCRFSDLTLKGINQLNYSVPVAWNDTTTYLVNGSRDNQNSPYAGLVLDAFHTNTVVGNRYPGFTSYYAGINSGGGSTDCYFENFTIDGFTVGIVLSPNGTTQNNESHTFTDFWLSNLKYGYVTCNSQERNVTLNNWKIWNSVKTCFANQIYGANYGDCPILNNINIAGNIFEIFNLQNAGYDPFLEAHSIHAETFYRIGSIHIRAYIENSKFHFGPPYELANMLYQTWVLKKSSNLLTFKDCTLFHYNNKSWYPFKIFLVGTAMEHSISQIKFISCNMNPPSFINLTPGNGTGSKDEFVEHNTYSRNDITTFVWDASLSRYHSATTIGIGSKIYFGAVDGVYDLVTPRSVLIHEVTSPYIRSTTTISATLNVSSGEATFNGTGLPIAVGWPIYSFNQITDQFGDTVTANHIGRVKSIVDTLVTIEGVVDGVTSGSGYNLLSKYQQYLLAPIVGDITSGRDSITNVLDKQNFVAGSIISSPFFPKGTYVTSTSGTTIFVSKTATATETNSVIAGYEFIETGYTYGNPIGRFSTGIAIRKGTKLINIDSSAILYYICTRSGVFGTANLPQFKEVYKQDNRIIITLAADGSVQIPASIGVDGIRIKSASALAALKVGTTDGGEEVLASTTTTGSPTWNMFTVSAFSSSAYTLYFDGITSSSEIIIYTK